MTQVLASPIAAFILRMALDVLVIVLAVEFALWRRTKRDEASFARALSHGESFDTAVNDMRKRLGDVEKHNEAHALRLGRHHHRLRALEERFPGLSSGEREDSDP